MICLQRQLYSKDRINMNDKNISYFIYARKSSESEDRQVLSIQSQKSELLELIKRDQLSIADIKEEAHSAKAPGRPIFNELLDGIEASKGQGLIVWNVDRLSRNSVDTGRLIYLFDTGKLLQVVTPSQVFRNTPNDKFLLSLLCSQAKLDNDNKGINVKRGLKAKAERGIYPCPAPTGYLNNKYAERGNKTVETDPDRFDLLRKMLELVSSQKNRPLEALKIGNEEWGFRTKNGKKLSRSGWYHILTNPFYAGTFEYPLNSGNWYEGIHKPMISKEQFDLIQIVLGNKGRPRPKTHTFAFTGLMRCGECNASITCEEKFKTNKGNGKVHHWVYYHCTKKLNPNCTQKYIEEKPLEKQILETLNSIQIPSEFHNWALKWLRKLNQQESMDRNMILLQQQKAYKACLDKIDELIDMRAAKEISAEDFARKKTELEVEKSRFKELLDDTDARVDKWMKKADELFTFAQDAAEKFNTGGLEDKRYILSRLGSNLFIFNKILRVDLEERLIPMKEASKETRRISDSLEPVKGLDRTLQLESSYSENPTLLRVKDSDLDRLLQRQPSYH